jgi:hypothetical protein
MGCHTYDWTCEIGEISLQMPRAKCVDTLILKDAKFHVEVACNMTSLQQV